jgi:hypothetical protein
MNAFQANMCIRGAFLGSSLRAILLTKAAPELASKDRRWLDDGSAATEKDPSAGAGSAAMVVDGCDGDETATVSGIC